MDKQEITPQSVQAGEAEPFYGAQRPRGRVRAAVSDFRANRKIMPVA